MIFTDALPKIKTFLRPAGLKAATAGLLIRLVAAFCCHAGRMSCASAASAIRSQPRHRAQLARFLARSHWSKDWSLLNDLAGLLLKQESQVSGTWFFLLDQTYVGQQGQHTENTFSRANYRPRAKKGNRQHKKQARRSCHGFVMGLLLTPSGLRIPCCRCFYTLTYCESKQYIYRKQTELAAELIRQLVVPADAAVVVLGDTAFEAKVIRQACQQRQFVWVVPLNPERVLAGDKPRPKVQSLVRGLSAEQLAPIRLVPGTGPYAAQRRAARCRLGPKQVKTRTFYAHSGRHTVHNIGEVVLVFSTKEKPTVGQPVVVQKILMSNAVTASTATLVEWYDLRWQIELFFKELKSTLGFAQYRFRKFVKVEGWTQACLATFVYLEWYRAQQLARRDLSAKGRQWWGWQRSHGLRLAMVQQAEEQDVIRLYSWSGTRTGRRKLRRVLRQALPLEYREPA